MGITRRQFIKYSAVASAAASLPLKFSVRSANAFYQSPGIPLFQTTLRGAGPGGIPVALPGLVPAPVTGVAQYQIGIIQFQDQITPVSANLGPTTLWGYAPAKGLGGNIKPTHLSGIIIGQKGTPIQIGFQNRLLVNKHIIPVDTTIPMANQAVNRTAVHLHGGLVPWISDGGPFDWFDPHGNHGLSFLNNKVLNPLALPGTAQYYYPLYQSARFMWYHDHAVGITRLNAYAGIASGMLIRDSFEAALINKGLPNYIEAGGNEIPLVFQDKIFVGTDINSKDPKWSSLVQKAATQPGSLWYAHTYEGTLNGYGVNARWDGGTGPSGSAPDPSSIPEFFGDTMLVNGTTFPEATVQARRYRLRLLNACNARFLNLQLYIDDGSPNGITLDLSGTPTTNLNYGNPTNTPFVNAATGHTTWLQIGTEGGFLSKPAEVASNQPFTFLTPPDPITGQTDPSQAQASLIVAPAERPDLIVDFSSVTPGTKVVLYSDAPAPFPSGDDRNDYSPGLNPGSGQNGVGNPVNATTAPGSGPNSRVLMRFKVIAATGTGDLPLLINTGTDLTGGIDPFIAPWGVTTPPPVYDTRFLTLNEYHDEYGRLIQILGNSLAPSGSPYFGTALYADYPGVTPPATVGSTEEEVIAGETEVWEVFNTTGDVHPMHFHLVNVQVINRQLFDVANLSFNTFTGPVIPPETNELGWKETVPMYPGTVTRVIMRFDLSKTQIKTKKGKVIPTPVSPRTGGFEYVWHCHILEHEEHDMMHALVVH
jgi:spore coat protein A